MIRSRRMGGRPWQRAQARFIARRWMARRESPPGRRPGILAGTEEDGVGVLRRLLGQRGDVQAAERDVGALGAVVVGERVGAGGRGDVDLDDHQVRLVVQVEPLHMLVLERHLVVVIQIAGERRQAERREERVLDGPEEGAEGFGERRQDHLDFHGVIPFYWMAIPSRPVWGMNQACSYAPKPRANVLDRRNQDTYVRAATACECRVWRTVRR